MPRLSSSSVSTIWPIASRWSLGGDRARRSPRAGRPWRRPNRRRSTVISASSLGTAMRRPTTEIALRWAVLQRDDHLRCSAGLGGSGRGIAVELAAGDEVQRDLFGRRSSVVVVADRWSSWSARSVVVGVDVVRRGRQGVVELPKRRRLWIVGRPRRRRRCRTQRRHGASSADADRQTSRRIRSPPRS